MGEAEAIAFIGRAEDACHREQWGDAIKLLDIALAQLSEDEHEEDVLIANALLARAAYETDQWETSRKASADVLRIAQKHPGPEADEVVAYVRLVQGWLAMRLGKPTKAIEALTLALQKEPDRADAWSVLGLAHLQVGEYKEAEAALRRAVEEGDRSAATLNNLAEALRRNGDLAEAERRGQQAILADKSPTWHVRATLAQIYIDMGDRYLDDAFYLDALGELDEAKPVLPRLQGDPPKSEPHALVALLRGYALMKLSRIGEAARAFDASVHRSDPGSGIGRVAERNLRRINRRRGVSSGLPPVWLPYLVTAGAAILIAILLVRLDGKDLTSTGFSSLVLGSLLLVLCAFSFPTITKLKAGPLTMEKNTAQPLNVKSAPLDIGPAPEKER